MLSMDANRGSLKIQLTIEGRSFFHEQRRGVAQSEPVGVLVFGDCCATPIRLLATLSLVIIQHFVG
jgi:hypothetical protein